MKYKYKCNECGHQFNLRSYNKNCEKCSSLNIVKQGGGNKKFLWIFLLLIILVTVGYLLKDIDFGKVVGNDGEIKNSSNKYITIYHEVENGNSISFKLITEEYDTVPYNSDNHSFFNLTFSNITGSDIYNLDNNKLYPCEEGVRYTWNYDTTFMTGQTLISKSRYVTPEEFESFIISEKAICKVAFEIMVEDPTLDNNCRFFVYTTHPDNQKNLSQIDTVGFTYFTKGDNLIEISVTGKDGPYLKQNEFAWDSTLSHINVWVRSAAYPNDPKSCVNNGIKFEPCMLPILIDEIAEIDEDNPKTPPKSFDWKKFKKEIEIEVKTIIKNPDNDLVWEPKFSTTMIMDGKDIGPILYQTLDQAKSEGKNITISEIEVSRKGPQILKIILKSN